MACRLPLLLALLVVASQMSPQRATAAAAAASPSPPPDPSGFYVSLDIRGTVNGLRRRKMGVVTLRFSPSWAPTGVSRIREVQSASR